MNDLFATITPTAAHSKPSEIATVKNRPATPHDETPEPRAYPVEICAVCGKFGAFGFNHFKNHNPAERFACAEHRDQVQRMGAKEKAA